MNRVLFPKFLVVATLATAALGATTVVEARPQVFLSIQSGPAWVERDYIEQPVYVQPRPVYVEPAPVYVRPPVFVSPREVFERPGWRDDEARFDWERERAWRHAEWRRRQEWREEFRGDDRGDRERHHDHRG